MTVPVSADIFNYYIVIRIKVKIRTYRNYFILYRSSHKSEDPILQKLLYRHAKIIIRCLLDKAAGEIEMMCARVGVVHLD